MENNTNTTTPENISLQDRLRIATETKTPGTSTVTPKVEPVTPQVKETVQATVKKSPWNSDDDFVEPKPKPTTTTEQTESQEPKVTEKAKRASARTVVGMYDMSQKALFIPLLNRKYKKKFTEEEIERLDQVADANKALLGQEDFKLRSKWDNLMVKRDIKVKAVPMNKEEKQDTEEMLYGYFDATNTVISPAWGLVFALINTTGKRVIDLTTD